MKTNIKLKKNIIRLLYKLINDLFYFNDIDIKIRLYVLIRVLKYEIFKLTHNEIRHLKYARTYKKLTRDIYIYNVFIKLYKYLRYYLSRIDDRTLSC